MSPIVTSVAELPKIPLKHTRERAHTSATSVLRVREHAFSSSAVAAVAFAVCIVSDLHRHACVYVCAAEMSRQRNDHHLANALKQIATIFAGFQYWSIA